MPIPATGKVLTHNPISAPHRGRCQTRWGRKEPFTLAELAEAIPSGWQRPKIATTGIGRNVDLFQGLMKWAGSPANLGSSVLPAAHAANCEFDNPLDHGEVAGLAKSVERYRRSWSAKGRFYTETEREAWGRALGLRSGLARRKGTPLEHNRQPWEDMGISRSLWYNKYRLSSGLD